MTKPNPVLARAARRLCLAAATALLACAAGAATITINGVSCIAVTAVADGSGNLNVTCGAAVPGAPVLNTAATAGGNANASIAFSAGAAPAATGYIATCTDGSNSLSNSGVASPIVVSGLTNGTTYTCSVTASNAAGTSAPSASMAVQPHGTTPATAPGAPTIGVATPGDTTASLAFSAPASDGGSAITAYQATCTPGATATTPAASPIGLSALTNGTTYTCYVRAQNAIGFGPASGTVTVTPAQAVGPTAPGAPTGVTAAATGVGTGQVNFSAPASNGGTAIDRYTATCTGGGGSFAASSPSSPISLSGLANSTSYSCTVTAHNAQGNGAASSAATFTTPGAAPPPGSAPATLAQPVATALNASVSVAFTPDPYGTAHLYRVTCSGAPATVSGLSSPMLVSGLPNGVSTTCTVAAHNVFGWSAESPASVAVTPLAPTAPGQPAAPTLSLAGSGALNVAFTAPSPGTIGGTTPATITGYTVTCAPSGSNTGAASPITVSGLLNGTPYTCTVKATNSAALTGLDSVASAALAPTAGTPPSAPTIGTATAGNTTASVAFTPGAQGSGTLTNYEVNCRVTGVGVAGSGAFSNTGMASPLGVTGLTNTTSYTCNARTTTSVGTSGWSADSNAVVPAAGPTVPGAPTIGTATAGNASISVAFTAPVSNGGAAIDSYRATCGAFTGSGASSPVTVSGLSNGTGYTCTVAAHNSVGYSVESAASNSATPTAGSCSFSFPIGGTADATWSTFNGGATYPGLGQEFTSYTASAGVALQFVPTAARGIQLSQGVQGGPGPFLNADITISTCPHEFASEVGGQGIYCKRTNAGDGSVIWISVSGTQPNGNECMLTSGQTYYYNIIPNGGATAISKQLGFTTQ